MTGFRSILIAIFVVSTIILNGCRTTNPPNIGWIEPSQPKKYPVTFVPMNGGLWMDKTSSENLLKNVEEMDAYTEKMEALVEHMREYYGDK
jgi:hypothetical protein